MQGGRPVRERLRDPGPGLRACQLRRRLLRQLDELQGTAKRAGLRARRRAVPDMRHRTDLQRGGVRVASLQLGDVPERLLQQRRMRQPEQQIVREEWRDLRRLLQSGKDVRRGKRPVRGKHMRYLRRLLQRVHGLVPGWDVGQRLRRGRSDLPKLPLEQPDV